LPSSRRIGFFNITAPIYDHIFHPALGELCQQGGFAEDGFVVDIGGGTGRMAASLQNGKRKVLIADASLKMLLEATQRDGLWAVAADAVALPFPQGCFDGVLIADAYHHFQQREEAIQETARMLHKSGILYIFEPNIKKVGVKIIAFLEHLLGMKSKFFKIPEITTAVCNAGFKMLENKEDGASIRLCFERID
jgi:demethylmenaquinone methyltransferase/2-methoxy-6-polyprenyl-1,4-benzoquinol methylase